MSRDLHIAAADGYSASIINGELAGVSLAEFKGFGTYPAAWEDFVRVAATGEPFDCQLVLYHPQDPATPIMVGLACLPAGEWYYVRINRVWENGQWTRRRTIRLDVPDAIKA
jgi:hypothetical protein